MFKTIFWGCKDSFEMVVLTCIRSRYFSTIVCQSYLDKNLNFCFVQNDIECITVHTILLMRKNFKYIVGNLKNYSTPVSIFILGVPL